MIFVIADDLTGAAQVAGIGYNYGMTTTLLTEVPDVLPSSQLIVLATDTRTMNEEQAVAETIRICSRMERSLVTAHERVVCFKKVDAAVRGHVVGEIQAILDHTVYQHALYLPVNPSMGGIIRGGCCYLDNVPLDQTRYACDPDFPIHTASICLQLNISTGSHIRVPDALSVADLRHEVCVAMESSNLTLLAGSFDLFEALLQYRGYEEKNPKPVFRGLDCNGPTLIVCGSPESTDISNSPFVRRRTLPLDSMPREVFDGRQGASFWLNKIQIRHFARCAIQPARYGLILNIPYERSCTPIDALRLRTEMAEVVRALLDKMHPTELIIEGGATAYAIIQCLGWHRLDITHCIAPECVRMLCPTTSSMHVTFKPGSASWGDELFDWNLDF